MKLAIIVVTLPGPALLDGLFSTLKQPH